MDRVRLGRALGYGTRHAAKTVAAMVEAAAAPAQSSSATSNPSGDPRKGTRGPQAGTGSGQTPTSQVPEARETGPRSGGGRRSTPSPQEIGNGFRHLKRSVWQPLAVFSGALWLRVTGLFFGLIAFTVGAGAWRLHPGWQRGFSTAEATRFWIFAGVALVFAYFSVSSFVRANLKERRASQRVSS